MPMWQKTKMLKEVSSQMKIPHISQLINVLLKFRTWSARICIQADHEKIKYYLSHDNYKGFKERFFDQQYFSGDYTKLPVSTSSQRIPNI